MIGDSGNSEQVIELVGTKELNGLRSSHQTSGLHYRVSNGGNMQSGSNDRLPI